MNHSRIPSLLLIACIDLLSLPSWARAKTAPVSTDNSYSEDIAPPKEDLIGSLPYSNQWKRELPRAQVTLGMSYLRLQKQRIPVGAYTTDFNSPNIRTYSSSFGFRLGALSDNWDLWSRYAFGFSVANGHLQSDQFTLSPESAGSSSLNVQLLEAGLYLLYSHFHWVRPYIGMGMLGYMYRHSSFVSAADIRGNNLGWEPFAGIALTNFPFERALAFVEMRGSLIKAAHESLFRNGAELSAGLGLSF